MCESPTIKGRTGWRGWLEVPSRTIRKTGDEKSVDLTTHFQLECHVPQFFLHQSSHICADLRKGPSISPIWKQSYTWALRTVTPRHFYADRPGMDEVPLERMTGQRVVICARRAIDGGMGVLEDRSCRCEAENTLPHELGRYRASGLSLRRTTQPGLWVTNARAAAIELDETGEPYYTVPLVRPGTNFRQSSFWDSPAGELDMIRGLRPNQGA